MANYELSDEKAALVVKALRATAVIARRNGHEGLAKQFSDLAKEIEQKLYPKKLPKKKTQSPNDPRLTVKLRLLLESENQEKKS